jgi:hypothetical protein
MKSEKVIKVSIDAWMEAALKVTCGNTTREFKKPHWPTAGAITGFAWWLKENEWAADIAFKTFDENEVADIMLRYVTKLLEQKQAFGVIPDHTIESEGTELVNDNAYYYILNDVANCVAIQGGASSEARYDRAVWSALVREEMRRKYNV